MSRAASRVTGIVFLAVTALGFAGLTTIPASESPSDPGPGGYPLFVLVLMALCALGLVIRPGARPEEPEDGIKRDWKYVAVVLLSLAVYAGVVTFTGFILSTFLLTAALLWFAGKRKPLILVTYPVILSFALYYVFNVYLSVALPRGPLEGLIS